MNILTKILFLLSFLGSVLADDWRANTYISPLDVQVITKQVTELQWHYNTNMDAGTALRSVLPLNDPRFLKRVQNVVGVFCPDPIFQGWTATGGELADLILEQYRQT